MAIKTPRAVWTGTVSFGMVVIPVKLGSCFTKQAISRNLVTEREGEIEKLTQQYVDGAGEVVERADMLHGYDVGNGQYVLISDEEWKSTEAVQDKSLNIDRFVSVDSVDPTLFDSAYYVYPNKGGERAYRMLQEALATHDDGPQAAVARFVMRSKQYVVLIRPRGDLLVATVLVYTDELVDASGVEAQIREIEVSEAEVEMAKQLISANSGEFDPSRYVNEVAAAQNALIASKIDGTVFEAPAEKAERPATPDLLAALQASLDAAPVKQPA